ncbi:MAG: hypothetical protein IJE51_00425 [Clostridia bacterium]|nr:hypothetical protein [Clostridia bacterium]
MSIDKQNEASFICKSCGAKINVDVSQVMAICDHCGNSVLVSELLNESDAVKVQKIKSQAYKDVEMGKQQLEAEKIKIASEKGKQQAEITAVEKFKKSKFSKVLIAFAVISALMCAVAFNNSRILAGLVALVQIALFGISWLMGMQIIKEKKNGIRVIAAVVAFVLFIPYFNLSNAADNKGTPFEWNDIVLSEMLPTPDSTVGEIHSNSQTELMLDVHGISEDQFNDYINACKEKGFTIEADLSGISFTAYNQDGYKLSLSYYESSSELSINIDAPMEMSQIQWPNSEVAKLLPVPKSTVGSISWENSGGFVIYIGNTTKAEYDEYVNACSAKGFNVDYNKGDDYYYADNSDGYHISLRYEGNNVMWIRADEPDETATNGENNNSGNNTEDTGNSADKYSNLKLFISTYNSIAKTDISDLIEIDIQSPEYYRTEFRLNAYQNAPAYKGSIGNNAMEIINSNYDGIFGSDLRIYAFVDTLEAATDVFESFCKACDSEITKEDFDEFYEYRSLDSGDCRIVLKQISGYVMKDNDGYEILLDGSPDYFDQE